MTVLSAAIAMLASCSTDSTDPTDPTLPSDMVIAAGDGQLGLMAAPLPVPLTVRLTDHYGTNLSGVTVAFTVSSGGGRVGSATVTSDERGFASTIWTLGSGAEVTHQTVTASAAGIALTFNASATALVTKISGDSQTAEVTQPLAQSPTVLVLDAADHPVPGLTVQWVVSSGGGNVSTMETTTDASGETSNVWSLGPRVGRLVHSLSATIPNSTPVVFMASGLLTSGSISVIRGDQQRGLAQSHLPIAPAVLVTTPGPGGVPVKGVVVQWSVVAGGGTITTAASVTDSAGVAAADWMIGDLAGSNAQQLKATAADIDAPDVLFVETAVLEPSIEIVSGNDQAGMAGMQLPQPLVVLVRDEQGEPLPGAPVGWWLPVDWDFAGHYSITDASGHASWTPTLGSQAGVYEAIQVQVGETASFVWFTEHARPASGLGPGGG